MTPVRLSNGIRTVIHPRPHSRSIGAALWVAAGSRFEPSQYIGMAHLLEHLIFNRSDHNGDKIVTKIESVGGEINACTDKEFICFFFKLPSRHLELAVDVLKDLAGEVCFLPNEIEREKEIIREEILQRRLLPSCVVKEAVDLLLWPGRSLGRSAGGDADNLWTITADDLHAYLANRWKPSHLLFSLAGGFDEDHIVQLLDLQHFMGSSCPSIAEQDSHQGRKIQETFLAKHLPGEQLHLCLGIRTLARSHPGIHLIDILNALLGRMHDITFVP